MRFALTAALITTAAVALFAALDSSPTSSAALAGDVDCDMDVDVVDALFDLRFVAKIGSPPDCIEDGDTNCNGEHEALDALGILRFIAALPPLAVEPGCPPIGSFLPTATPTATNPPTDSPTPSLSSTPTTAPTLTPSPSPTPTVAAATSTPSATVTPSATPAGTHTPSPTATPLASPTPTPSPPPSGGVITRNATWYTDIINVVWAVGEVYNGLGNDVGLVEVTANFYSASNQLLATRVGFACLWAISPGGDSSFDVLLFSPPSGIDHVTVSVTDYFVLPFITLDPPPVGLSVDVTDAYTDAIDVLHLGGTVTNNSLNTYESVRPCAAFYNSAGEVVRTRLGPTNPDTLGPGQSGTFEFLIGLASSANITGYRVWVHADYQ